MKTKLLLCLALCASFASAQVVQPSGGTGTVTSVFGRTPVVTAQSGDYTLDQICTGTAAAGDTIVVSTISPVVCAFAAFGEATSRTDATANVTYATTDRNKVVIRTDASNMTDTLPAISASYPDGFIIYVLNTSAAGTIQLATGSTAILGPQTMTQLRSNGTTWEVTSWYIPDSNGVLPLSLAPTAAKIKTCQVGIGGMGSAIAAGPYTPDFICYNDTGVTLTITAIACASDDAGTSTANFTDSDGNALLTGAITLSTGTWVAGVQSATVTLASGKWLKPTFTPDGTNTKQIMCRVKVTL